MSHELRYFVAKNNRKFNLKKLEYTFFQICQVFQKNLRYVNWKIIKPLKIPRKKLEWSWYFISSFSVMIFPCERWGFTEKRGSSSVLHSYFHLLANKAITRQLLGAYLQTLVEWEAKAGIVSSQGEHANLAVWRSIQRHQKLWGRGLAEIFKASRRS